MARLIYALLALAAVALVAGFLISSTNLPLIGSTVFSAIVAVLILYGNSRRLRQGGDLFETDAEPAEDMEDIVAVEEVDLATEFGKPSRRSAAATKKMPAISPGDDTKVMPPPKEPKTARKPAAKKKPASTKKPAPTKKVASAPARASPAKSGSSSSRVSVIPGRSKYHRAGCRFAKGDDVREVTVATAERRGYVACTACFKD